MVQLFSSFAFPAQPSAGLSHFRVLVILPEVLGHFALHFDHGDHFPQFPARKVKKRDKTSIKFEILSRVLHGYAKIVQTIQFVTYYI